MTQEQHDYEMGANAQAQAEYEQQMEYYDYLDKLIESKQYQLHGINIALDILNSKQYYQSGLSAKDYLQSEKKRLIDENIKTPTPNEGMQE